MKKLIARVISPVVFWIGHFVSRCLPDRLYPVYNWLMGASLDLEDWAGIEVMWSPKYEDDPWGTGELGTEEEYVGVIKEEDDWFV